MIYKTFFGKHIDLSKLVCISDAMFMDGWFEYSPAHVRFDMEFQLLEHPIIYRRGLDRFSEFSSNNDLGNYTIILKSIHDGDDIKIAASNGIYVRDPENLLCVHNLQKQINEIIQEWKRFKKES